jgi:hypothetical protein
MGIPGNEVTDKETKIALNDRLMPTKKYPPQDFIIWIKMEATMLRKKKWQNSENPMKARKRR